MALGSSPTSTDALFRALLESAPDAMVIVNELGTIVLVNSRAETMFGYSRDEFVGQQLEMLVPQRYRADHVAHRTGYFAEPRVRDLGGAGDLFAVCSNGDEFPVEISLNAVDTGTEKLVISSIRDVTDRHRVDRALRDATVELELAKLAAGRAAELEREIVERELAQSAQQASEARYRALFEYAPDGIVIATRDSTYLDANPSMLRMLGYTRDEFIGMNASDIVTPAEVRHIGSALHAINSTADYQREWQFRRKNNSVFTADVIATMTPDGNILAVVHDVTDRIQADAALRSAEERMRFALQAARVGVWDMDYTTGILRWSETMEQQYGLPPGGFAGTFETFIEQVHPEDREGVVGTIGNAVRSGTEFFVQNRARWPDGTVHWLEGSGRIVLGADGHAVRGIGISMDVTDRRLLEEQFQQSQKMEAIGRLAGGVAHDFNNLLTVILGNCELLRIDLADDNAHHADIEAIQNAATSAAGLTRQLLAFSRKEIIEPALLDLNDVVTSVRVMIGRLIGEDVKVVLALGPDLARVMADHGQVEQIILNLSVNARDAMPRGGTLTLETANVELDENYTRAHHAVKPGPYVRLTVTDTGTGMTPDVQARLFEPFFTTKEVGRGTGLGLATVYGIVTRAGGGVNVYSEIGRGTSFDVYFPSAEPAPSIPESSPMDSRQPGGSETILIVEDADGLRVLTRKILERQGYTVLAAGNADEAFQAFQDNPAIELLLTDVVMPGPSGPELAHRLAALHPALKVVYMSGYTEDTIVHHGVLRPGISFLHKPFTSDALGRKIREALDR